MEPVNFSQMRAEEILKRLKGLSNQLSELQKVQNDKTFLDTAELCIAMNISKRTAQIWRSNNIIGYIKIGRKYYYKLKDIHTLLDDNYVPPKSLTDQ